MASRSRFVVPSVVLVAAFVAAAVVMRLEPSNTTVTRPTPTSTVPVLRQVSAMLPDREDEGSLPLLPTDFPAYVDFDAADTVPLASDPVRRALALFQASPSEPVLVLGDDRRLRSLSVKATASSSGEIVGAVRQTSLSADGRTAVFPQRDAVLVVDLTTGISRSVPVTGPNVHAAISPDGTQLVTVSGRGTFLVDVFSGTVIIRMSDRRRPSAYSSTETTALGVSNGRLNPEIMVSSFRGPEPSGRTVSHSLESLVLDVKDIPAARGKRIAVSGTGGYVTPDVVVMTYFSFMPMAGAPPRVLGAPSGYVRPLRWLDDSTLLVASGTSRPNVLAWNVDTGVVSRVMSLARKAEIAL